MIPNITLFAISAFRFGHFLESHHGFHLGPYYFIIMGLAFAFEVWYMLFGFSLLVEYFKKNHFKEFYVTQWGFICPLVAFVVLGAFAYNLVLSSPILYGVIALIIGVTILFYFDLLIKQIKCSKGSKKVSC